MPALENVTTTVPVGQYRSFDAPGNIMDYGMAGSDPFEFVKLVQTGEVTFDSTDPNQQALVDQYEQMAQQANANNPNADLPSWGSVLAGTAVSVGAPLVAKTFLDSYGSQSGGNFLDKTSGAVSDMFKRGGSNVEGAKVGDTIFSDFGNLLSSKDTTRADYNIAKGWVDKGYITKEGYAPTGSPLLNQNTSFEPDFKRVLDKAGTPKTVTARKSVFSGEGGEAFGVGLGVFGASLLAGEKPKQAAKRAIGSGVGKYLGSKIASSFFSKSAVGSLFGPIGAILGGALGGRVICNELMRQGILDRKHVLLDYRFTRDYLTPTHVRGYHVWAVWMVKQMRKGKFVKFWKHVAGHRANEIAYIYGERDKPDYLGKVYRKILEPICWSVGLLCKKSDWSILYKTKEI